MDIDFWDSFKTDLDLWYKHILRLNYTRRIYSWLIYQGTPIHPPLPSCCELKMVWISELTLKGLEPLQCSLSNIPLYTIIFSCKMSFSPPIHWNYPKCPNQCLEFSHHIRQIQVFGVVLLYSDKYDMVLWRISINCLGIIVKYCPYLDLWNCHAHLIIKFYTSKTAPKI